MKRIEIETNAGVGEAIKEEQGDSWTVSLADRSFNYYGSVPEMKAFVRSLDSSATFEEKEQYNA